MSIRIGSKIIASYNEPVLDATTDTAGKVRLAKDTEIDSGTSTSSVITPKQLANKDFLLSKNGVKLYDWIGTKKQYDSAVASDTIKENWICWIIDDENM